MLPARRYCSIFEAGFGGLFGNSRPSACIFCSICTRDPGREWEFPIFEECTYINTASQGPWPTRTMEAVRDVVEISQFPHTAKQKALPNYEEIARTRLARLIGAGEGDIVFTSNTTH